jgi:hypothetical protein
MGMDELYKQLKLFLGELHSFNNATKTDWDRLQASWDRADQVWDVQGDATRRQFEKDWREMGDALKRYREQSGDRYERFLVSRKQSLDRYFGNR